MKIVPYSQEYKADLDRLAAAPERSGGRNFKCDSEALSDNPGRGIPSNDYYESDVAWMDLDAPIDVTIGPYETYNDELFGYKAAFEAYITIRDDAETDKVKFFSSRLQEIENNLPIDREVPESEDRRAGADSCRERADFVGRCRAWSSHRGFQSAERRARRTRKGQQARHAEERAGSEVQEPS